MGILDSLKKMFGGSAETEAPQEEAPMEAQPQEEAPAAPEAQPAEGGEEERMQ